MRDLRGLQEQLAETCGDILVFLSKQWQEEKRSEFKIFKKRKDKDQNDDDISKINSDTKQAEHFVCLLYVNFILSMLMRMRTFVMIAGGMFVFILLSLNSYPFEPKQTLHALLVILFLLIIVVVAVVYAQMHRDATLSRITDTTPGELGSDFWIRLAAFGAVPLLSLLLSQYTGFNNFLFSWLQPALESLK